MMIRLCVLVLLAAVTAAENDCVVSDWGEWTEWTRLDCGEEPSGAARPVRDAFAGQRYGTQVIEGPAACISGVANGYSCANVDQQAVIPSDDLCGGKGAGGCGFSNSLEGLRVYGWVDQVVGNLNGFMTFNHGTSVVRMTDTTPGVDPVVIAWIDGTNNGDPATERAIITVGDYAYITANVIGHGMQIINLNRLRNIADGFPNVDITILQPDVTYRGFDNAASFSIGADPTTLFVMGALGGTESCGGGILAYDVSNPTAPAFQGCFSELNYVDNAHCMAYTGRDDDYNTTSTEVCYAFNGTFFGIVDTSDKANMRLLSIDDYGSKGYIYQGVPDSRETILLQSDYIDETENVDKRTRTQLWTINNLDNPFRVVAFTHEYRAIDSRVAVKNAWAYQAHYEAGLRVQRIDEIRNWLYELGFFDIVNDDPTDDVIEPVGMKDVFVGFLDIFDNGRILASSTADGLWVFQNDIIVMHKMAEEGLTHSRRFRYREILEASDVSTCPDTVQVEMRYVHAYC